MPFVARYEVDTFEQLVGADARKVILFLAVMAVHAVGEGGGVGVSFAGNRGWAQVSRPIWAKCIASLALTAMFCSNPISMLFSVLHQLWHQQSSL